MDHGEGVVGFFVLTLVLVAWTLARFLGDQLAAASTVAGGLVP